MGKLLWQPSEELVKQSNMTRFMKFVNEKYGLTIGSYDALYDWLAADLHATEQPAIFVFGHEPAYPHYRHVGDSLDDYPANRNRFWQLLHDTGVVAYICGHTHDPEIHEEPGYDTLQVDVGQARGTGSHDSFVDVKVKDGQVEISVYRGGTTPFILDDYRIVQIEPVIPPDPPYYLTVNTQGQGIVNPSGGSYDVPTDVLLTALPETGWMFDRWEGDLSGSNNPETILMDRDRTVTAVFIEIPPNQAPSVDAGTDLSVILPNNAFLDGTVTDDGVPPQGVLTTVWSQESGPAPAPAPAGGILRGCPSGHQRRRPGTPGHGHRPAGTGAGAAARSGGVHLRTPPHDGRRRRPLPPARDAVLRVP